MTWQTSHHFSQSPLFDNGGFHRLEHQVAEDIVRMGVISLGDYLDLAHPFWLGAFLVELTSEISRTQFMHEVIRQQRDVNRWLAQTSRPGSRFYRLRQIPSQFPVFHLQ